MSPGARSGVLPRLLRHSTLCCRRETMSARARTAAGSRERGRPRSVCQNHLRGVSLCACSKKDGTALLAKRRHCTMVKVGLDAGEGAEPLLQLRRHVRLAPFCTGLSWLVVTSTIASCIASTISRCRWLVTSSLLAMPSCTATCSATAAIVSCIGCPRRHHAGGHNQMSDKC